MNTIKLLLNKDGLVKTNLISLQTIYEHYAIIDHIFNRIFEADVWR